MNTPNVSDRLPNVYLSSASSPGPAVFVGLHFGDILYRMDPYYACRLPNVLKQKNCWLILQRHFCFVYRSPFVGAFFGFVDDWIILLICLDTPVVICEVDLDQVSLLLELFWTKPGRGGDKHDSLREKTCCCLQGTVVVVSYDEKLKRSVKCGPYGCTAHIPTNHARKKKGVGCERKGESNCEWMRTFA